MRFSLAGLAVAVLLVAGAPAAQASDASLKRTVASQQTKLLKAAKRYGNAVKTIKTDAQLKRAKTETQKLARVVRTFQAKVQAEHADTAKYKKARTKLLDALSTYHRGLKQLIAGMDAKSTSKLSSAIRTIASAGKKFQPAAKAFS